MHEKARFRYAVPGFVIHGRDSHLFPGTESSTGLRISAQFLANAFVSRGVVAGQDAHRCHDLWASGRAVWRCNDVSVSLYVHDSPALAPAIHRTPIISEPKRHPSPVRQVAGFLGQLHANIDGTDGTAIPDSLAVSGHV